jgi:hypothetical protein
MKKLVLVILLVAGLVVYFGLTLINSTTNSERQTPGAPNEATTSASESAALQTQLDSTQNRRDVSVSETSASPSPSSKSSSSATQDASGDAGPIGAARAFELMKLLYVINDVETGRLNSIAFESSGDHNPKDANYDDYIKSGAASAFGNPGGWGRYEKRSGLYMGSFQSFGSGKINTFHALMIWKDDGPTVPWIVWQDRDSDNTQEDISSFKSPFAASEIYGKSLHLPVRAFNGILNYSDADKEILVLAAVQNGSDGKTMELFNGRVYL